MKNPNGQAGPEQGTRQVRGRIVSEFGLESGYPSTLEDIVGACPIDLGYPDGQSGQEEMNKQTMWT